jgi:O-antigen/teichoic acid export membrane protein
MSQGKSILKNTLIYALGNFGSKILAFLLLPLYTYYLNRDEFGTYDLFIVTISLLTPILSLQISDAAYRWLIDTKDKDKQKTIIFNGFLLILITGSLFIIGYLIFISFVKIKYSGYFMVILLLTLLTPYFQKVLRGLGKNLEYAISGIISTFLILSLNILFLAKLNFKIESLFISTIIANIIVLIYILTKINFKGVFKKNKINKTELKAMIKYSLPLVPNSLSWWLINASDKYLILYFLNLEANGIYAISTRFPSIIMLLNSVFLMAWQDHGISAKDNKENMAFFSKLFNKFIVLELTFVIFLIAISPYLIKYLIDDKYAEAWKYLPFLFIGTALNAFAAYIGVGYQRSKKTKGILITSIAGGIANIIISLSLLPIIGLYAPALGTFISFSIVYILRKRETDKFFKINVNNNTFLILLFISLLFTYLIHYSCNSIYNIILVLVSTILLITLNLDIIKKMIFLIKINILKIKKNA